MNPDNNSQNNVPPAQQTVPSQPFQPPQPASAQPVQSTPQETNVQPLPESPTPLTTAQPVTFFGPSTPTPLGSPAVVTNVPAPGKFPKGKKTLRNAIIIGSAVLVAVIGTILYFVLTSVSQDDYRKALNQYDKVSLANSSFGSLSVTNFSSGSESKALFDQEIKDAEDALAKLKSENESLSKLKAVRVGEGAKLYGEFNKRLTKQISYSDDLIVSVKNIGPAMQTCDKVSDQTQVNTRLEALKGCEKELSAVTDIPSEALKTFVSTLVKSYGEYASTYESLSGLTDIYGKQYDQYKELRDKVYSIQDDITAASKAFTSALKKQADELNVKDSANALSDFITKQLK